jgi:hypothetical protein
MDHTYESSTVEMNRDNNGFEALHDKLLNNKSARSESIQDIRDAQDEQPKKTSSKKFVFTRGEESLELDDDYEVEIMADKRPTKLTLRELKERAAGDIAVKNRMHSLAEEKKRVQSTFKEFAQLAKKDPLGALEFISSKANESDSEFEYSKYIEKLAEQAEKLGQMDAKERKAWELEKKLEKAEQDLSHKERVEAVVLRKQDLLETYPEIGDRQFSSMVDAVLSSEELLEGLEDENDIMERVEDLIQETLTQRDIMSVIRDINPSHLNDENLIFMLSDQIKQNPDFDEKDVREILTDLIGKPRSDSRDDRQRDIRTLSNKARQSAPIRNIQEENSEPFDLLRQQLLERKNELSRTPLYMR